jgi:hypothetical protein
MYGLGGRSATDGLYHPALGMTSDAAAALEPDPRARRRRRSGIAAIVALGFAWALVMQSLGWAQTSYFAMVKALHDGTAQIDAYHWETRDKSYTNGHFFSVKAPGMPFLLLPLYAGLKAVGGDELARTAADNARDSGARQWTYRGLNVASYGYDFQRAQVMKRRLEVQAPLVWALGLLGSVLPAVGLLLLVRHVAERVRPGLGTASALALGMGTLVMPFAVQLFGHLLATFVLFAAFALLWREREGPPRWGRVAAAGLLCGLAVVIEYPLALGGAILGLFALTHPAATSLAARARRAGIFAGGVIAGVLPLAAYNLWAFGSVTTLSYDNAVDRQGFTGRDTLGLNDGGFFGIDMPSPRVALELLIAPRGLLVLTPVVALAAAGIVLLFRRGRRAEALTIAGLSLAFYVYDTGYWLPFGGGSPGPRFLIPILPFLAIGLAEAWRRLPATTLVTAAAGAGVMIVATLTYPLIGTGNTFQWWDRVESNEFQHTLVSVLGGGNGWPAILPVLALLALAAALGARATGPLPVRRDLRTALGALAAWLLLALVVSPAFGEAQINGPRAMRGVVSHSGLPWEIVLIGAGLALALLGGALRAERRAGSAGPEPDEREASAPEVVDDERPAPLAAHP